MQTTDWAPEHSDALRQHLAAGLSYAGIADALNAEFKTSYSRSAAIGRARRMGLVGPDRPQNLPHKPQQAARHSRSHRSQRTRLQFEPSMPVSKDVKQVKLSCVEIVPRHLSLMDIGRGDCRYPYGGDAEGEAITFCGHPQRQGSSYCTAHFHLTRGPGTASERAAVTVLLRLVEAA